MPVYNITVPAPSPFIRYSSGNWSFSTSGGATSFRTSLSQNFSVDVPFNGTGVYMYGDIVNGGTFTLDGLPLSRTPAPDPLTLTENPPFVARDSLAPGPHNLNYNFSSEEFSLDASYVNNITAVSITMGDGDSRTTTQVARIDDSDSKNISCPFLGDSFAGYLSALFSGGTITLLTQTNDHMKISFYGNDIAVYGFLFKNQSQCSYSVSLDGQPGETWPARLNVTDDIPGVLLYQSSYLAFGPHYLLIEVNASREIPFAVDYADVRTYITGTSATRALTPLAAIVGGVLGGLALVGVAVTCAFVLLRRRFRRTRFTFVGQDGIDGGHFPAYPEEDMPPPDYQRVFARGSGVMRPHAFARGRQRNPPDVHPSALHRFFGGKRQRDVTPANATLETSEVQHLLADITEPVTARHPPLPRPGTDPSLLAWKGQLPVDNRKESAKLGSGFHWRFGLSQK